MASDFDLGMRFRKHPLLSQFSSYLPATIKEVFDWIEFIISNNPIASAGIKKLSETPITSFRYTELDDKNEGSNISESSWKTILEKRLKLKAKLTDISYNTELYGNCFVSVYSPLNRFLRCTCGTSVHILHSRRLKVFSAKAQSNEFSYSMDDIEEGISNDDILAKFSKGKQSKGKQSKTKVRFSCFCDRCKKITPHTAIDLKSKSIEDINIITWNPKHITMEYNPISGAKDFFYAPSRDLTEGVKKNKKNILATMPIGMIESILEKKIFKFAKGHIFHSQSETIAGVSTSWGMPKLTAAMPAFMTLMILRKANEKIATDYMVPLRIMFPTNSDGPGNMYNFMGGDDFVGKINTMLTKWKVDPSGVQTTPFPIGTQTILGDGKLLTLNQEIEQLESNIASALGIPIEFIKGGLSYTAQGSSLRLLENQLSTLTANLNDALAFIIGRVSIILEKEKTNVELIPFKLIDDLQEKMAIIQLASAGQGGVSNASIMEMFNLDQQSEKSKLRSEAKDAIKAALEDQTFQQEQIATIEEKAKQESMIGKGSFDGLNQQALIQEADLQVEQLQQMDDGTKRSKLDEMSKTNVILYSVVKTRMEMAQGKQDYAAVKDARGEEAPQ